MRQHFMMFATYNRWANARLYATAGDLSDAELNHDTGVFFRSIMGTLNHILATDRIWLKRFTGRGEAPSTLDAILHTDLETLQAARVAEDARILEWIGGLSEDGLGGRFSYMTVSDMRTISQRLAPALSHLFNHQTHHRGQAHACLTSLGKPGVSLDMIYFQRLPEGREFA